MGSVREAMARLRQSEYDDEALALQESARSHGAESIRECQCGQVVTVCGPLRSVTLNPSNELATVEAELYDGSGRVVLVWLGRREIIGIEPGRNLTATGRLTLNDGVPTIFNPRYTLRADMTGE